MGAVGHKILCDMCNTEERKLARKFPVNNILGEWRCEVVEGDDIKTYNLERENGNITEHVFVTISKFHPGNEYHNREEREEFYRNFMESNPHEVPISNVPSYIKDIIDTPEF